jgi:hypothetical protein
MFKKAGFGCYKLGIHIKKVLIPIYYLSYYAEMRSYGSSF